jgi:AAA15 family ATPase/GTPase
MINSLGVKNYRNLKDLQIKSLGRVNLITGKNNVGKSSLLEAISIFVSGQNVAWLFKLLEHRGERQGINTNVINNTERNLKTFSALFHNREIDFFNEKNAIQIGLLENAESKTQINSNAITLSFHKYKSRFGGLHYGFYQHKNNPNEESIIINKEQGEKYQNSLETLEIQTQNSQMILPLEDSFNLHSYHKPQKKENIQFVNTQDFKNNSNATLWDEIILTPKEDHVIKALQIIEPKLERLTFIANPTSSGFERIPVIKLKNKPEILPLQSMGDGLNRILTMILNLVNAENGYFMIDEFENGLHYSVQEKLWKVVFSLAFELNIQVFATTHSRDCIEAFSEIVKSKEDYQDCQYIRLDLMEDGNLSSTGYSPRELTLANKHNIETR